LQGDEAAPQSGMVRFRFVLVPKRSTTIQKFLDLKLAAFPAKAASVFNLSIMILHCSTTWKSCGTFHSTMPLLVPADAAPAAHTMRPRR